MSVFKSEESKRRILQRYDEILSALPFKQRYVDTDFGQTFLLEAGETNERAVVLLHGSCSNSAFWFGEMNVLSQQYHVYAIDIPGEAGNSADNRLDIRTRDYADWLLDVLDTLAIDRANVVGNSLGGWMALKFAVTYPERVSKLALVATSGLSKQNPATMDTSEVSQAELADEISNDVKLPDEVQAFIDMILAGYLPLREELPIFTENQLKALTMPVLFVAGENDVMTDVKAAALRLEANLPQTQIRILPNTGHIVLSAVNEILPFLANAQN